MGEGLRAAVVFLHLEDLDQMIRGARGQGRPEMVEFHIVLQGGDKSITTK